MRLVFASLLVGCAAISMTALGCAKPSATPEQRAAAKLLLLAEEPSGAMGILDYRESLAPATTESDDGATASVDSITTTSVALAETPVVSTTPVEVVLLGKIGGAKLTWSPTSAEFVITDPAVDLDAHAACTDDGCPFCKDKSDVASGQALVRLRQKEGEILAVDARKVLPVEEGQMVVVRGLASVNAVGQLVVDADGIYIRR